MIKIGKLWSNSMFISIGLKSKLFYIYLSNNPSIMTTGVICPNLNTITNELGLSIDDIRSATTELMDKNYIRLIKHEEVLYFIVVKHYSTLSRSQTNLTKITNEFKELPTIVVDELKSLGITTQGKMVAFKKPTEQEVIDFAMSKGYLVNANDFIDYYESISLNKHNETEKWYDGRGKLVKSWKQKLQRVWFKDDRKLKALPDAPKGYEYFHIITDGSPKFPDKWVKGKPISKDFLLTKELQKAYEFTKNST